LFSLHRDIDIQNDVVAIVISQWLHEIITKQHYIRVCFWQKGRLGQHFNRYVDCNQKGRLMHGLAFVLSSEAVV